MPCGYQFHGFAPPPPPPGKPPRVRFQKSKYPHMIRCRSTDGCGCCKDTKSNPSERRGRITPCGPVAPNADLCCINAVVKCSRGMLRWLFRRGDCHFLGLPVRRPLDLRSRDFVAVWFRRRCCQREPCGIHSGPASCNKGAPARVSAGKSRLQSPLIWNLPPRPTRVLR